MSNVTGFKCVECAREHGPRDIEYTCPSCGGNLDVLYDYDRARALLSRERLSADRDLSIWRYRPLLPIEDDSPTPQLKVGWTPIYSLKPLAAEFGIRELLIKDDTRNPTGSLKDRPSALAVVKAQEAGASVITTASSGNAGSALAGMCASAQIESAIFVPASAPPAKLAQIAVYGARLILVEGSYDEAYDLCIEAGKTHGWYQRSTGFNPFMAEGKKTAALEIAEQMDWQVPDRVFVGVGDGCIIGGLWKGFNDLHRLGLIERLPRMVGVQGENASAIVDAANGDGVVRPGPADTIADSICVGKPRDATKAVRAIRESNGCGVKVSDDEIISSIGRLARASGVFAEPAAAASFAGFVKMCDRGEIKSDERILLVITGSGLKDIKFEI
ncbi:MAG TPA: threonine synthase [Blastocatellia bacterium]|nr:threonine synthase [Blastocatellia bacterium]